MVYAIKTGYILFGNIGYKTTKETKNNIILFKFL